jgi:uncharacterized protein YggU (UPF0235/DUF167 family)
VGEAGELSVRVRAVPADGAANAALLALLARALDVPHSAVVLQRGASSRTKRVAVEGVDPAAIRRLWPNLRIAIDAPDDRRGSGGR